MFVLFARGEFFGERDGGHGTIFLSTGIPTTPGDECDPPGDVEEKINAEKKNYCRG